MTKMKATYGHMQRLVSDAVVKLDEAIKTAKELSAYDASMRAVIKELEICRETMTNYT